MGKFLQSGRVWPYAIGMAIFGIFSACVASIVVTTQYAPVQLSNDYMMNYHEADSKANRLIDAQIAFDKKYNLKYLHTTLDVENSSVSYKITDKNQKAIDDAKIKILVTRPDEVKHNMEFDKPEISNGVYSFRDIKLPLEGRWNIIAKVDIGENTSYYNIKTSTRVAEFKREFKAEFKEY
jgi:nitrogen fixation protein FixH